MGWLLTPSFSLLLIIIIISLACLSADSVIADPGLPTLSDVLSRISGARMLADVARLSAPDLNGRQTGTTDDLKSGRVIAERFAALGLTAPDSSASWMMTDGVTVTQIDEDPVLEFHVGARVLRARVGSDYLPILDSPSANVTAPIVFVGYGISDPAHGFDEYEGLDVRNRVVLFLRGKPEGYPHSVTQTEKERTAREKGALAFLTMTGPIIGAYEARRGLGSAPQALYSQSLEERPLPGAWISTELGEAVFPSLSSKQKRSLREIHELLNQMAPQSIATSVLVHLAWTSRQTLGQLNNVIGLLSGRHASTPTEAVVIGAHRDHFGRQAGLLFPGADDNASGTAVLLEVARVLKGSGLTPARSILFVSFSGEEQGLVGSRLYISRPVHTLKTTKAMINIDHAGVGNGRLIVGVTDLPKNIAAEAGRRAGLSDKLDLFGFFPGGDHVPFKEAGIPTITVVSGGAHPHFHQPSDTAETVQPAVLEAAARYVATLAWELAQFPGTREAETGIQSDR